MVGRSSFDATVRELGGFPVTIRKGWKVISSLKILALLFLALVLDSFFYTLTSCAESETEKEKQSPTPTGIIQQGFATEVRLIAYGSTEIAH